MRSLQRWSGANRAWGIENSSVDDQLVAAIESGTDVLSGFSSNAQILNLVKGGKLSQARVDLSVRRLLKEQFQLGLFGNPYSDDPLRCIRRVVVGSSSACSRILTAPRPSRSPPSASPSSRPRRTRRRKVCDQHWVDGRRGARCHRIAEPDVDLSLTSCARQLGGDDDPHADVTGFLANLLGLDRSVMEHHAVVRFDGSNFAERSFDGRQVARAKAQQIHITRRPVGHVVPECEQQSTLLQEVVGMSVYLPRS